MQPTLALKPQGATSINEQVCVVPENGEWVYYISMCPVYWHAESDDDHFRLVIAQLIVSGACRHHEIVAAFGLTKNRVCRAVRQLRERGIKSFFEKRATRKGGTRLTAGKLSQAQTFLNRGMSRQDVAEDLQVKKDTLRKAINDGRLEEPEEQVKISSTLSERSMEDAEAAEGMGTACTRLDDRTLGAIFGMREGAPAEFTSCLDVPNGGSLCALPALLANGLLSGITKLGEVKGYYSQTHILLVLAIMCVCRIKTVERLQRHYAPGELGNLLGLDRIPEVRCLRYKMDDLAGDSAVEEWAASLSRQWMEDSPETAGFLYVDGHVKVYSGANKLPRRFVSRERLCLRGISTYWVNDAIGQPFFLVEKQIDPGLLETLREDIVPRLLAEVPNQPTEKELEDDPELHRFVIVFDREGYSPAFFKEMWEKYRIACMTYRKNCTDQWALEEFAEVEAVMPRGEKVKMALAERYSRVGSGSDCLWVKEVRKLTNTGHQTAVISTGYSLDMSTVAVSMFTRWCQENFFAYAMHHFPIEILADNKKEVFSGTEKVVNPAWREATRQRNTLNGKITRRQGKFMNKDSEKAACSDHRDHEKWEQKKAELLEEIQELQAEKEALAAKLKDTPKHITWDDLCEEDKFMKLPSGRRRLINTVGMITYRAETAMISMMDNSKLSTTDARAILQGLFTSPADLFPDEDNGTLTVRVHTASTPAVNRHLAFLFNELNESETVYPGTNLTMRFTTLSPAPEKPDLVPPNLPRDQDI